MSERNRRKKDSINESEDEKKKRNSSRSVEVFHNKSGSLCHTWTITDLGHYQAWKEGRTPLRSLFVLMPDGKRPTLGTQVRCGTCGDTGLDPKVLIYKGPVDKDQPRVGKSQGIMRP